MIKTEYFGAFASQQYGGMGGNNELGMTGWNLMFHLFWENGRTKLQQCKGWRHQPVQVLD
jgi:hypothetical protein